MHPPPLLPDDRPLATFLSPRGRIGRRAFWLGLLVIIGVSVYLRAVLGIARVRPEAVDAFVSALALWPLLAHSAKRWHDRDASGWWALVMFIPVIGWVWMLIANGALPGTPGPNRHGPAPG